MKTEDDIWGVKGTISFKADIDISDLAVRLSEGLMIPNFTFDTDQDFPHEKFGTCEAAGFEYWLNKLSENSSYTFVLKMESSGIPEAVFNDRMFDVSLWLAKNISEKCGLIAYVATNEGELVIFENGVIMR